jgi:hypothetical protein
MIINLRANSALGLFVRDRASPRLSPTRENARGDSGYHFSGSDIVSDHRSGSDERTSAHSDSSHQDRTRSDRDLILDVSLDITASPISFGLELPVDLDRTGVLVVDEHHAVAHEAPVTDVHSPTNEGVAADLALLANGGPALHLNEGSELSVIADTTTVEIDEAIDLDALTQDDVVGNTDELHLELPCFSTLAMSLRRVALRPRKPYHA